MPFAGGLQGSVPTVVGEMTSERDYRADMVMAAVMAFPAIVAATTFQSPRRRSMPSRQQVVGEDQQGERSIETDAQRREHHVAVLTAAIQVLLSEGHIEPLMQTTMAARYCALHQDSSVLRPGEYKYSVSMGLCPDKCASSPDLASPRREDDQAAAEQAYQSADDVPPVRPVSFEAP